MCQLRAEKQSADAAVEGDRRIAERQVQFYLRKLDELRSYLSTGASAGPGTGTGSQGGGGGVSRDSCAAKDPCGGPGSNKIAAGADQALIGGVTRKLTKDIDALAQKLKSEAKMYVSSSAGKLLTYNHSVIIICHPSSLRFSSLSRLHRPNKRLKQTYTILLCQAVLTTSLQRL